MMSVRMRSGLDYLSETGITLIGTGVRLCGACCLFFARDVLSGVGPEEHWRHPLLMVAKVRGWNFCRGGVPLCRRSESRTSAGPG
jgi:hypothetical protein